MNRPLTPPRDSIRLMGWGVLALAFVVRAFLAWRGGQLFWPDEDRFEIARRIAAIALDGRLSLPFNQLDHLLLRAAAPDTWAVGYNRIGASTASEFLGADIVTQASVPAEELLARREK